MTRRGFCLSCRKEGVFTHVIKEDYACVACGSKRTLTINQVTETAKGGVFGRFWSNVKVTPFCWPWITPVKAKQGPRFKIPGFSSLNIARVAYFLHRGVWPKHAAFRRCANILCCRPDHILDLPVNEITKYRKKTGQHLSSGSKKRRYCHKGHPLSGHNLVIITKGQRWAKRLCRKCRDVALHNSYIRCKERRELEQSRVG